MIRVQDILSAPMFSAFRVVSAHNGLSNPISQAGFFEWESGSDIQKNFAKNEFVITTLAMFKDDQARAESYLRALIHHQVCAIAIKDVYFHEISESLKKFSDERNVPIMFFSDLFIDDVLFYIKTVLRTADSEEQQRILEKLLFTEHLDEQENLKCSRKLNPFFEDSIACCAFLSPVDAASNNAFDFLAEQNAINPAQHHTLRYSFIPFRRGFFYICTAAEILPNSFSNDSSCNAVASSATDTHTIFSDEILLEPVRRIFPNTADNYRMGICRRKGSLKNLSNHMREAYFANISCCIDSESCRDFSESGIDKLIFPAAGIHEEKRIRQYYDSLIAAIESCSDNYDVLISTLENYAKCDGDINLTASMTYQHSNTIRYRIQKIRNAWGGSGNLAFNSQLFVFYRLHNFYKYL